MTDKMMTLQPVAMRVPNGKGIYAPSKLRKPKKISKIDFIKNYTDHPLSIFVSFDPDGISNPRSISAYGVGCDCWYIVI